jgi:hypothetical protein
MTDREKCAFVYGFSRGIRLMSGMYEAAGHSAESAENASRVALDDLFEAVDPPEDEDGILGEIDAILRSVGIIFGPAPAQERN